MFEQAGHHVSSWRSLSPRLKDRADCIVWFPDDFHAPSRQQCEWLEEWLRAKPGRTLICVGRDFDAAPWYWEKLKSKVPADERPMVECRLAEAKNAYFAARAAVFQSDRFGFSFGDSCDWFSIEGWARPLKVRKLSGDWAEGIEAESVEIELMGRVVLSEFADVWLESEEGDTLVSCQEFAPSDSRLIVVANGSFLLNAPLVNHEHRKLAGKLIETVGSSARNVVFLESEAGGPPIRRTDPQAQSPTGMEAANAYPINWILLHFAAVGIVFCFWRWPIFGRPQPPEPPGTSDFGKHIDAVGDLLRRSRDRGYVTAKLAQYRQGQGGQEGHAARAGRLRGKKPSVR
jgi:hypothetical protein